MSYDRFLKVLKASPKTIDDVCEQLGLEGKRTFFRYVQKAEQEGIDIKQMPIQKHNEPVRYYISTTDIGRQQEVAHNLDDGHYKIAISSDYHINDRAHDSASLNKFYREINAREVDLHLFAGDMTAGMGVYKGQENDVTCWGFDEQLEGMLDGVPDLVGIDTYAISGNHDLSFMKKNGADIMKAFTNQVNGWQYVGAGDARIFLTPWIATDLHHNIKGGSAAYSISYKAQQVLRNMSIFDAPDIFVQGHWHRLDYYDISGIKAFEAGTFQGLSDYAKNMGFGNSVGGLFVDFDIKDERIDLNSMTVKIQSYNQPIRRIPWDLSQAKHIAPLKTTQKVKNETAKQ